jgi:hypothetical protein
VQTVPVLGCSNEVVTRRYNLARLLGRGRNFAPDVTGFEINVQNAVGVMRFESLHPRP